MEGKCYVITPDGGKIGLNATSMQVCTTSTNQYPSFELCGSISSCTTTTTKAKDTGKFGGYVDGLYITKVIVNKPAYIVFWSDGSKTTAKCSSEDNFDAEKGLMLCTMKKMKGAEWVYKLLNDWCVEDNGSRTLSDVRKMNKTK